MPRSRFLLLQLLFLSATSLRAQNDAIPTLDAVPISIKHLRIHDDASMTDMPSEIDLNQEDQLMLQPNESHFSFEFEIAGHSAAEASHYRHRLTYDRKEWWRWNQKEYSGWRDGQLVRYEHLPPGRYLLTLQDSLPGLAPIEHQLRVVRKPFWYETLLAKCLFIILPLLILHLMYRRHLRHQLQQAEARRLRELDRLKTRLYHNITHEFRTPLTVILGLAEQVKEHLPEKVKTGQKAGDFLGLIHRNGQQLLRMVNQMLDLAKLEAGQIKLHPLQADIIPFIKYLSESFESLAASRHIRLMTDSEVDALSMDFDPYKIEEIISNLLSNAVKFTSEGGKVLLTITQQPLHSQPHLQIKVKDSGIGIPADQLPRIFDRFYQADASGAYQGTGIGMALTKELVELMGGQISVESVLDKGTVFTILLPVRQHAPPGDPLALSAPLPIMDSYATTKLTIPALPAGERPKLLIIEDNRDVIAYLQSFLEQDYDIALAYNGQSGIDQAFAWVPDVIISDVMMPEKTGYEVCDTLKNDTRTSHIPILLLTAKADEQDKLTGLQTGADAYLIKPFNRIELLVRLEKMVALRQQLHSHFEQLTFGVPTKEFPTAKEMEFLKQLQQAILERMEHHDLNPEFLARAVGVSRTHLYRKLDELTGQSVGDYVRSMQMQKARELLRKTDKPISEIADEVGFSDPSHFSRCFLREFKIRPSEVRK